jgi:hypothetical protein
MALTTFRSWVTGELVTAAMMNQQVRDNGNAIWVGTTAGDMDYYTGATTKARLPIGTAGQILKVNAGATAPEWGSSSGLSCYGYLSELSESGLTQTTWTDVPYATVDVIVPKTSTLFAIAQGRGTMSNSVLEIRWMLDGTEQMQIACAAGTVSEAFAVVGIKAGVTAGTKSCKLQYKVTGSDPTSLGTILGFIIGFAE